MYNFKTTILVFIFGCISCSKVLDPGVEQTGTWSTALPENVGMNATRIRDMVQLLNQTPNHEVHSILIVKNGLLVFEQYFLGSDFQPSAPNFKGTAVNWSAEKRHNVHSVTKSVTSIIAGIAIDRGLIPNVNAKVFDFFPTHNDLRTPDKYEITLEHLLTMSSGLQWDETSAPYNDPANDLNQLFTVSDQVRQVLSKNLMAVPGSTFTYNGGGTNVLGEVIRKSVDARVFDFGDEHLFKPLGITDFSWAQFPSSQEYVSGDLYLRPRDMAKLGYLYLNYGVWDGQQIVSREWVEQSTKVHTHPTGSVSYGYQWWIREFSSYPIFHAQGWGGQTIAVIRDLNMVVVTTGGNYDGTAQIDGLSLMQDYIIPAAR